MLDLATVGSCFRLPMVKGRFASALGFSYSPPRASGGSGLAMAAVAETVKSPFGLKKEADPVGEPPADNRRRQASGGSR